MLQARPCVILAQPMAKIILDDHRHRHEI